MMNSYFIISRIFSSWYNNKPCYVEVMLDEGEPWQSVVDSDQDTPEFSLMTESEACFAS